MLTPQTLEGFGGLNLTADPDELGANGCVDGIDFDLSPGKVRSRDGYTKFTAAAALTRYDVLAGYAGSNGQVVAVRTQASSAADALDSSGTVLATSGALAFPARSVIPFGTPSASYAYLPVGSTTSTIKKWDGSSWSDVAVTAGYASLLGAIQPQDNRLVLANGLGGNKTRVRFSNAGDPETFSADDYVDLAPGTGDDILGIAAWNNELYVFLRHRFVVFYGNSTDATGEPIFNYRTVDTGVGASASATAAGPASGKQVVAGPDGVYFVSADGVYRTTGGTPMRVSEAITPTFSGPDAPFFSQDQIGSTVADTPTIAAAGRRVYVSSPVEGYTLVYDVDLKEWMVWSLNLRDLVVARWGGSVTERVLFSYGEGTNSIGQLSTSATTDDGTAIDAYYRSGLYDLGTPNDKAIHHSEVHGTGTVGFSVATNREAVPTARTLTLGTAPVPSRGYDNHAPKPGEFMGYKLSSVNGAAWEVDRITHYLRPSRAPALRAA